MAPMSIALSSGGPTRSFSMRARSFVVSRSAIPSCMSRRDPAQQTCPWLNQMASTTPSTTLSRSASSNTMNGLFPPSSSDSFFPEPAVRRRMVRPTSVEPVNAILSTSECWTISSPVRPSPVTTFSTPGGSPDSCAIWARHSAVSGVNSAGFRTIVFPAAAGNTIVLKPAEFTPLTALCLAQIAHESGLPPGVLNVVTGDGRTGELIVQHSDVDKIAFTGSTEVGRIIRRRTAGSGKKLSLELGGKSPFIVFDDADLDSVVEGVVDAIWFNQGQVCCAGSRLLIHEGIAERLTTKLRARMEKLRVGPPLDKAIDMGAIVAPVQLERIRRLVTTGVEEGATMWQPSWACPTEGYFYPPTLFTNVSPAATIAQVEIFGPVLVSMAFRTPAEAVELANNTPYGLAASVWTENINLALDVAPKIKAGVVWINCTNLFDAASGFGGYRESGFGREGGREGMWEYLEPNRQVSGARGQVSGTTEAVSRTHPIPDTRHPTPIRDALPPIDRTYKLFIGGKQVRPDQGYARQIFGPDGKPLGEVGEGNPKDIRDAVEAAHAAQAWARTSGHSRGQILYYVAENLAPRRDEFAAYIEAMTGRGRDDATRELDACVARLFTYAAWADKYDGAVHDTPIRGVKLAMNEPIGVIGIGCPDEYPLLEIGRAHV